MQYGHKDYSSGIPIQISIYKDKIYIANDGRLPDNWTIDALKEKHKSRPFNPLIANVFYKSGMIESWGRGIEKIKNYIKENSYINTKIATKLLDLKPSRTREIIAKMVDEGIIIPEGANRNRKYKLP